MNRYMNLGKLWNMRVMVIPIVASAMVSRGFESGLEKLKREGRNETIQTTSFFKICQDTVKSPRDLRRLAVTQTPVKDYQLTLV